MKNLKNLLKHLKNLKTLLKNEKLKNPIKK